MAETLTLMFAGDALPPAGRPEADPFAPARKLLEAADVRFINLEGCIGEGSPVSAEARKKNVLWTDPHAASYLRQYGFQVVNISNNHVFDLGLRGCLSTIRELEARDMKPLGLRNGKGGLPVILEAKGMRIGFLGYADYGFPSTLASLRKRTALRDVRRLASRVDLLVVSLHWGYEYVGRPSPWQRHLARALVRAGANLVIGQHPHVSQGIELYDGALICYSLGNFFFSVDEMPGSSSHALRDRRYGFLLSVTVGPSGIIGFQEIPVSAYRRDAVELLGGRAREKSLERIRRLESELARSRSAFIPWILETSVSYALLFRNAWAWRLGTYGVRQAGRLILSLLQEPILLLILLVSFIRSPAGRGRPAG
jgi:poly-gamma-glutamate capsule biosynthesis protein CapA/YwtB (metallophosphatase superfamily)